MNLEPLDAEPRQPAARRRGPTKFAYSSGSTPLDGYTIKRGIGAGGFGDVYYATSEAGKDVALKRIQRNLDVELRGVKQCLNLKHPNLVALYDIRYDNEEQAWVVMEYVSGESLQDVIERNPNGVPHDQVDHWFSGIISGVAYLHDHGIVHRDLKPGNIFMDQGAIKIGDYGLSKFISCSRRSGQTESVGTFHYMAPEIGLGRYGKEIDIYALGIMLYEMLTGRVPFEGESSQEIIMKHLTAQPDLNRIPPRYRQIVARAMAKDPSERFSSVGDILVALNQGGPANATANVAGMPGAAAADASGPATTETVAPARANASPQMPTTPPRLPRFGQHRAGQYRAGQHRTRPQWTPPPEEPIAAGVRSVLRQFRAWFDAQKPFTRAVVAVAMVLALLMNWWVVGVAFSLCIAYACYFLVWSLVTAQHGTPPATQNVATKESTVKATAVSSPVRDEPIRAEKVAPKVVRAKRKPTISRHKLHGAMRNKIRQKPVSRWLRELTGSMLLAALVAAVAGLILTVVGMRMVGGGADDWTARYTWLTVTSIAAAWPVLLLGKLWEGSTGDVWLRRFCLLVTGMSVGCFAGLLASSLMLDPVYYLGSWKDFSGSLGAEVPLLYEATGRPRTLAYAGYFGGLFMTLRWWLGTDPLRSSRVSFFGILLSLIMAAIWYMVLPIPGGFFVVATAAVAVQLASSWVPQVTRDEFKQRLLSAERKA